MAKRINKHMNGWIGFAGFVMIIDGFFGIFEGLNAVYRSTFYTPDPNALFNLSMHTLGWTHLLFSALILIAGFAVLLEKSWGKTLGIFFALLSSLAYMAFIPYYSVWSILIIVIDILVIYALIVPDESL
jgi:hypothetical protein